MLEKNRGEIVEQKVRQSPMSQVAIYTALNISQNTLTKWFQTKDLSYDKILQIGDLILYDFPIDFPELKNKYYDYKLQTIVTREPIEEYQNKYIELKKEMLAMFGERDKKIEHLKQQVDNFKNRQ